MRYSELTERVLRDFFVEKKDYPQDLLYPILKYDTVGNVMDMFMVCALVRNEDGSICQIEEPSEFYMLDSRTQQSRFIRNMNASDESDVTERTEEADTSIEEFTSLYMSLRDFAFGEHLSGEQKEVLRKMVYIYDVLFEEKVRRLYHKYSCEFFLWAYRILAEYE